MGQYSKRYYRCPYMTSEDKLAIRCEGGQKVTFIGPFEKSLYIERYCLRRGGGDCQIAKMLEKRYDDE